MKKVKEFRNFEIKRTCTKKHADFRKYKKALREDFNHRCAYCNIDDEIITTYFEIDHFIPRSICEEYGRSDLLSDYSNLVYSCKKCNLAKSNKYEGSLDSQKLKNSQFYDPVEIPLQSVFYRNTIGGIDSDEIKGRKMIIDLKLYRLSHNYEWINEELRKICQILETRIAKEENPSKKNKLRVAHSLIAGEYNKMQRFLISNYNKDILNNV
ncbi:HNH endonuclease [Enterococcus hulanensis]|uniref:HNH endonuclease n=1 Tax=Enterococcus hulanensis TaxID=2559929 RepID=UPI001A932E4E|nr:HNH endonuclease [Enterococcus hulanensis]MBO0409429.1 HNH endonuclease [Enterococcus hulanensis]